MGSMLPCNKFFFFLPQTVLSVDLIILCLIPAFRSVCNHWDCNCHASSKRKSFIPALRPGRWQTVASFRICQIEWGIWVHIQCKSHQLSWEGQSQLDPWKQSTMACRVDTAKLCVDCSESVIDAVTQGPVVSTTLWLSDTIQLGCIDKKATVFCQRNVLQDYWKTYVVWGGLSLAAGGMCLHIPWKECLSLLAIAHCQRCDDLEEVDFEIQIQFSSVSCSPSPQ